MKVKGLLVIFFWLVFLRAQAQQVGEGVVALPKIPEEGMVLEKGWKWQAGDNPAWAGVDFDDSGWAEIDPTQNIVQAQPQIQQARVGWLRLRFFKGADDQPLAFIVQQSGASEIYLNGKLIRTFGKIGANAAETKAFDPLRKPFLLPALPSGVHTLAVRYALQPGILYTTLFEIQNPAFWLKLVPLEAAIDGYQKWVSNHKTYVFFLMGTFFILATLHLSFYRFYPPQKSNLYFGVFAFLFVLVNILHYVFYLLSNAIESKFYIGNLAMSLIIIGHMFLQTAIYSLLNREKDNFYWLLMAYAFISIGLNMFFYDIGWRLGGALTTLLITLNTTRIALQHIKTRKRGAWIIFGGTVVFFLSFGIFFIQNLIYNDFGSNLNTQRIIIYIIYSLSIPIATSVYLGLDFAITNINLKHKLTEVEELSQKAIIQEQEKQHLLATQNETLEQQVTERTAELKQSIEELKATQSQLIQKEKMASLGELTAGIAHEIQNPLNFVNNFSEVSEELVGELQAELAAGEVAEANLISADLKENLSKIHYHGKRADSIVKSMLLHSRTNAGQKQPTDLNSLAEEYLRLAYHGFRAKGKTFTCTFHTDFGPDLEPVAVVPQEIGQVLLNLFNNAFYAVQQKQKCMPAGAGEEGAAGFQPTVKVTTRQVGDRVELRVWDNGVGVPEQVKAKVFQPFFTTKPAGSGTGLGLSLSFDIVTKSHGGEIKLNSKEGVFAESIIALPVATTEPVKVNHSDLSI